MYLVSNERAPDRVEPFADKLRSADVISFDFFDTLVERTDVLLPKDVFLIVQSELSSFHADFRAKFVQHRIWAEFNSRARAKSLHGSGEVTLSDIYSELATRTGLAVYLCRKIMRLELKAEKKLLRRKSAGYELYRQARRAGKRVVITTDTYFDPEFIGEIARKTGYSDVDGIFCSGILRSSKAEGGLFTTVLDALGCPSHRLLHVGDNILSDVSVPLGKGIRSHLVSNTKQQFNAKIGYDGSTGGNIVMSKIVAKSAASAERKTLNNIPDLAVAFLPVYLGYAQWLIGELSNKKYDRLYFVARDGYIIKKIFDMCARHAGLKFDTRYLAVSRSTLYPTLIQFDPDLALSLYGKSWDALPLSKALSRLHINAEECQELLKLHDLVDTGDRPQFDQAKFAKFFRDAYPLIRKANRARIARLQKYLRQQQFAMPGRIAIVDLGWHGSLQVCLKRFLDYNRYDVEMDGYYLATFANGTDRQGECAKFGFLASEDSPGHLSRLVRASPSLIELLHSAPHGTVTDYRTDNGKMQPVFEDNMAERRQYVATIEPVQKRAVEYLQALLEQQARPVYGIPGADLVAKAGLQPIYAPTFNQARLMAGLKISTDFGGGLKSITGIGDWNLDDLAKSWSERQRLPDGTYPMWVPGLERLLEEHRKRNR
jgi:predicted HAD superfamily hydrolase